MNKSSYLDPAAVKQQCNDMINCYRSENINIARVRRNLQGFIDDDDLKTDGYQALKNQVSDYMLLLSGMRQANKDDIVDCNTLINSVGDEVLNGYYLITGRDASLDRYHSYRSQSSSYSSMASSTDDEYWSSYYSGMASYYSSVASSEYQKYLYYVGKISKYDSIESSTCHLFKSSKSIRDIVSKGLADVSNNYSDGKYHASSNSNNWKKKLKKSGAKVKVYSTGRKKISETLNDVSEKVEKLYDLNDPIDLVRHGVWLTHRKGEYYFSVGGKNRKQVMEYLESITGKEWKGKALEQAWKGQGLNILGKKGKSHLINDMMDEIDKSSNLGVYIGKLQEGASRLDISKSTFRETFLEEINPTKAFGEFRGASKLGKAVKGLGIVGDAVTVFEELEDNFCEDGDIIVTPDRVQNFITDTAVDFGTSAGTTAAGAAIGSFFLPPAGTIIGAGIGMGLDYLANKEFKDFDGDGQKDSVVDGIKDLVDMGCNKLGGLIFG